MPANAREEKYLSELSRYYRTDEGKRWAQWLFTKYNPNRAEPPTPNKPKFPEA